MDDDDLARRAATGDRSALELLAERHRPRIRAWALVALGRADAADDATQEVLLKLVRSIGTFEAGRRFLPWLRTLVRNTVTDERRRDRRQPPDAEHVFTPDPEARLDARRQLAGAQKAFEALTPRQREAYLLCEVQATTAQVAAIEMGIEPATVRVLLHQARRAVRASILEARR